MALSANDLYLTANVFNAAGSSVASIIYRIPLDGLAAGGSISYYYYYFTSLFTLTPVAGATTTMYFASHLNNATLEVYAWPEGATAIQAFSIPHSWYVSETATLGWCPSPDGYNMCGFDDSRVEAGWVAGGVVGFMWDAAQGTGGLGSFPYPYIHVVRISQASMSLIDEPVIWSSSTAVAYPGVGVDGRGALGGSVALGGGGNYPSSSVFVRDDISPSSWQGIVTQWGTNGPAANRWGDFLTAAPASGNSDTWVAGAYTLQGGSSDYDADPHFVWFGRERDNPFTYSLALSSTAGGTVTASPPGPVYPAGLGVTLTATAYSGYAFVGWTLDGAPAGSANPAVLTMDANHSVVATFVPLTGWSPWASQGGILTDAPAAAGLGGRVYVFAKGSDAALYVKSSDTAGNFTDWQDLGGILTAAPAAASFDGRLYAFAKGSDNALYVKSSADGVNWSGWDRQGGILLAPPAAASANGRLFVFAMGTDRALYAKSTTDGVTWGDWQRLGGILTAAPAAAGFQNQIYAFAKGSDNALYVKSSADGVNWTDWTDLAGTLAAAPAAATTGDGATLYAFGTGPDGNVSERHTADGAGWTGWAGLGGQVVGPPAAASVPGGPLFVFARWVDNALWERHLSP